MAEHWRKDLATHREDIFAHSPMTARLMLEDHEWQREVERRLSNVERFNWALIGGIVVLSSLVGGGLLGLVGHLLRIW